jgi:uncharacterized alkaline shock family protein YloU
MVVPVIWNYHHHHYLLSVASCWEEPFGSIEKSASNRHFRTMENDESLSHPVVVELLVERVDDYYCLYHHQDHQEAYAMALQESVDWNVDNAAVVAVAVAVAVDGVVKQVCHHCSMDPSWEYCDYY